MAVLEKDIQKMILSYLQVRRVLYNRINNGKFVIKESRTDKYGRNRNSQRAIQCNTINGIPDIEVFASILKGDNPIIQIPIYLEVKSKTGRQSKNQKVFEKKIKDAGGYYYIVRGIEDVKEAFEITAKDVRNKFGEGFSLGYIKSLTVAEKSGTIRN